MSDSQTVIKKVNAFPFPVQFKTETASFSGKIVKLTKTGFLAEVAVATLQPLEKMECSFEFPVLQKTVSAQVIVVKIYNHYVPAPHTEKATSPAPEKIPESSGGSHVPAVAHLVEMHFRSPSLAAQEAIQAFLAAVERQK